MDMGQLIQMLQQALGGQQMGGQSGMPPGMMPGMAYPGGSSNFRENMGAAPMPGTDPRLNVMHGAGQQQPPWMQFLQQMFSQQQGGGQAGGRPLQQMTQPTGLHTDRLDMGRTGYNPPSGSDFSRGQPGMAYAGGSPNFRENVGPANFSVGMRPPSTANAGVGATQHGPVLGVLMAYFSSIGAGFGQAQDQQAQREQMQQRAEIFRQVIEDRAQEQADKAYDRSLDPDILGTLKELWSTAQPPAPPAVQPPLPGEASQPMMRPPDTGMTPGVPTPPMGAGGSAAQLMAGAAQGGAPMAAPQAQPPQGWSPSAAAPPSLGGQMAGPKPPAPTGSLGQQMSAAVPPPAGAAPPGPAAAGPAAAPGAAPQPGAQPGAQPGELPPQWLSIPNAIKAMDTAGVPKTKQLDVLKKMLPIITYQNEETVKKLDLSVKIGKAMNDARAKVLAEHKSESTYGKELDDMGLVKGSPEYNKRMEEYQKKQTTLTRAQGGGRGAAGAGAGGFSGSLAGYNTPYAKMDQAKQSVVDWYATTQLGGDSTWRVGLSRNKGGSDLIKAVDERVPTMARELGLTAADVGTNKAKRVAAQSALTANTKDLATLEPYANMLDQNAEILKGLATKAIATNAALANKPLNWLRKNAADSPDLAEYLAQMEIVKNEATRVISNPRLVGQMTDTARQEIESIINGDMPLNATTRVLERLQNDSQRRVSTMRDQQSTLQGTIKEMFPGGEKSGGKEPPATNAKGWKLHKDKDGNQAYVSPDGKDFEEVVK